MSRPPRPEDLYRLRMPTEPRLSSDGTLIAFTVQTVAPTHDGYRTALWLVPADGSAPARQLTIGSKHDRHPRFSPDGRTLAFLSDRRLVVEEDPKAPKPEDREDGTQVYLLPLDGGEARRVTDLPRGVDWFEWSPDGGRLVVGSSSVATNREEDARRRGKTIKREPDAPPESDYRYVDRLNYMLNGAGFTYDRVAHAWIVDVTGGEPRRLTDGPVPDEDPAWSPDGSRIAFARNRRRDHDLRFRRDIVTADVATGYLTPITAGPDSIFFAPAWLPDGRTIAALGGRIPANVYRSDIWLFAADGSDSGPDGGRNLSDGHDLMPASTMNSDVTIGEGSRLFPSADGRWIRFAAPIDGAFELWRIATADGRVERLTNDRHYISSFDLVEPAGRRGRRGIAAIRSNPTQLPDVHVAEGTRGPLTLRRVTDLNAELRSEVELREPVERHVTVDGRDIQGWLIPAGDDRRPLVTEIHGGPHTFYGWSPFWEFQMLAANGMSVFYCNPRGSEGYGRAFSEANLRDWGEGPTRDVLAGVDALVDDGLADPDRLGVTGGSYGGYLTNWIVGHDQRFRAAIACRSVADLSMMFLTGDISQGEWAELEFGTVPWNGATILREQSPITYAERIRTPLLIQHSERDIRTTVGQAEALFTVLRSLKRPVRLMRVPDENHELTRSGTPFRRVENLVQVRDWFRHFLVDGRRGLPPAPTARRRRRQGAAVSG
jgi:dipeptidyl aminopeptidase/acylaminoacyl peptidase